MNSIPKIKEYQEKFSVYGYSCKSLKWNSYSSAALRYKEITADLDFNHKTVLDVGCGFGDLLPYLFAKADNFKYTGIDMVPEFIEGAKKKSPDFKFILGDYFAKPLTQKFDLILCCGALNSKIKDALQWRQQAIKLMYQQAKVGVAFNMAGQTKSLTRKKNNSIYYAPALSILKFCLSLSPKVIFRQHYHPKDFTIIIYK